MANSVNTMLFLLAMVSATVGSPLQHQFIDRMDPLSVLQSWTSSGLPQAEEEYNSGVTEFESDMLLTHQQRQFITSNSNVYPRMGLNRKAIVDGTKYWPQAIVPYEIGAGIDGFHVRWIVEAMIMWSNKTCIRFLPRTPLLAKQLGHNDFIRLTNGTRCRSRVGRVRGGQEVAIGRCRKGSMVHELGHTIGYVHEQSRPDRDLYVDILRDNILPGKASNFLRYPNSLVSSFGLPYDYGSIMHYSSTAFSVNGRITVRTLDSHLQMVIGQRIKPSFLDIQLANKLYKCSGHCPHTASRHCNNGGYVGPDCTCMCPEGLSGMTCDLLDPKNGCGGLLTSTAGTVQTKGFPMKYSQNSECYWLIRGPPSSRIVVTFERFDTDNEMGCRWCTCDYLEVKIYGANKAGQRYCGTYVKTPIIHNSSSLLLRFHSDAFWSMHTGIRFSYNILGQ